MSGLADLERLIERVRQLPRLPEQAAPDIADAIAEELARTIAAGTDPTGSPWTPTQAGDRPLKRAADAVKVAAVGRTIWIRLVGVEARHHLGTARGGVRRQIIPDSIETMSPRMISAIHDVLARHFADLLTGEGPNG